MSSCLTALPSGVLQGKAEGHWEHGHGYEAAEPADRTREGQAVRALAVFFMLKA